ncbi:MAG: hypothetical protein IBX41_03210 [Methanophagales archaeon]|nr:hypothetical protein [Methanophagales archaeon]
MHLTELLDAVIFKEVYEEVKVERKLHYHPSELPEEIAEKIKSDKEFRQRYKEILSILLQKLGHENLEVLTIDPSSNSLEVRYTAYYLGCRQFPEIHLKTLLVFSDAIGVDIRDPDVFDTIVEKARRDLGEKNKKEKEERLNHFAPLFKRAIDQESVNE